MVVNRKKRFCRCHFFLDNIMWISQFISQSVCSLRAISVPSFVWESTSAGTPNHSFSTVNAGTLSIALCSVVQTFAWEKTHPNLVIFLWLWSTAAGMATYLLQANKLMGPVVSLELQTIPASFLVHTSFVINLSLATWQPSPEAGYTLLGQYSPHLACILCCSVQISPAFTF